MAWFRVRIRGDNLRRRRGRWRRPEGCIATLEVEAASVPAARDVALARWLAGNAAGPLRNKLSDPPVWSVVEVEAIAEGDARVGAPSLVFFQPGSDPWLPGQGLRRLLLVCGLLGVLLCGALLAVTWLAPQRVADAAQVFIKAQIETELRARFGPEEEGGFAARAMRLADRMAARQTAMQRVMEEGLPELIAQVLAQLCGYDCERSKAVVAGLKGDFARHIKSLAEARTRLAELVRGKYVEVVGRLLADLRIFLGVNLMAFAFLAGLVWRKTAAGAHLSVPAVFLLISTVAATALYVFGRSGFFTVVYADYLGWGYLLYVGGVFGLLLDVACNQGRLVTAMVNRALEGMGSTLVIELC